MSPESRAAEGVTSLVHVGLVVEDLDETVRFLALLSFDCTKPAVFSGEWIGRIIGLEDVTVEVMMARWETMGQIVDHESTFRLCYLSGPEGPIVELAERLENAPADLGQGVLAGAQADPTER